MPRTDPVHTLPWSIPADHPCLPGHFPGDPLVPGVLLLDAVAAALRQAGAGRLARLDSVKFTAPLRPDETATIELEPGAGRWRFRVRRGATLLAEGRAEVAP